MLMRKRSTLSPTIDRNVVCQGLYGMLEIRLFCKKLSDVNRLLIVMAYVCMKGGSQQLHKI